MAWLIVGKSFGGDYSLWLAWGLEPQKGEVFLLLPWVPQGRIYYHCLWDQLAITCSNATEVAKYVTPSCSRQQPATDNGVRESRSNWLASSPPVIEKATLKVTGSEGHSETKCFQSGHILYVKRLLRMRNKWHSVTFRDFLWLYKWHSGGLV